MSLNLKNKEDVVHKILEIVKESSAAVVAAIKGVKVNEINQLRKSARDCGVYVFVIRNTLLRRIIKNTVFLCLENILFGQNIIAFSTKAPNDSIKICIKFSKGNENFKIKGVVFEGKFIDSSQMDFLSHLPTHKESLLKLVTVIKINSMGNLINILRIYAIKKSSL